MSTEDIRDISGDISLVVESEMDLSLRDFPKMSLLHGISPVVMESKGELSAGQFYDQLNKRQLGRSIELVVLDVWKERMFKQKNDDSAYPVMACFSPDGVHGLAKNGGYCQGCPLAGQSKDSCRDVLTFMVAPTSNLKDIMMYQLTKTSFYPGQTALRQIQSLRRQQSSTFPFLSTFILSVDTKKQGTTNVFVPLFTQGAMTTEEQREECIALQADVAQARKNDFNNNFKDYRQKTLSGQGIDSELEDAAQETGGNQFTGNTGSVDVTEELF